MDHTLQFLSNYATSLTYESLSEEVVHQVKRRIIDTIGCAMGAYEGEPSKIACEYAMDASAAQGATVLGASHITTPERAAFANGVMMRYLDFNDTSADAKESGHPSDNMAAVLAAAEYARTDAKTAITGIVLSYEVQGGFDEFLIRDKGWDYVTYVAVSSTAGAGKALGLTQKQMANALSISATSNAAFRQTRMGILSMWKGCAAANAARNGVFAALMAKRGLTGPEEAFEGAKGFLKQITGPIELLPFGGIEKPFRIQNSKFKYFPACYHVQCAIESALGLRETLNGTVDQIEKIIINAYDIAVDTTADSPDKWDPLNRETADHSMPYIVAVALTSGRVCLDDFTEGKVRNPLLRPLMQKIEVHRNEEFTRVYSEASPIRIEIITRSGQSYVKETRYAKGHPQNPMSDQEIESKFRKLAESSYKSDQIDKILDQLWRFEQSKDLTAVLRLFALR